MNLLSLSSLGLLSVVIPFGALWMGRQTPSSGKTYSRILAAGVLVYFLVKSLGDASVQAISALPPSMGSWMDAQQWAKMTLSLLAGFFIGLTLPAFQSRLNRGLHLAFWAAAGLGLYNLGQCLEFNMLFIPTASPWTVGLLVVFILRNALQGFAMTAPLAREDRAVSTRALFLFAALVAAPFCCRLFMGTFWTTTPISVFVLSTAGGALLYVFIQFLRDLGKKPVQDGAMAMFAVGFILGLATNMVPGRAQTQAGGDADADKDRIAKSVAGIFLPQEEIKSQDNLCNDILHGRAMEPKRLPDGTKEFDLTASVFTWQLYNNARVTAWGYNGQVPGPLIRLKVGDKVALAVKNELPQATSVHWHGLAVPNKEDGVPDVTQKSIAPGEQYTYRFVVTPQMVGTHLYHSHVNDDFQVDKGLHGILIVDPAKPTVKTYDVEAAYEMASFKAGGSETENIFTLDGKAYPEAPALRVGLGSKVLIRLVNASGEESHVMHLHGYTLGIVALDGNPLAQPVSVNTVLLAPSQTADIAFVADNPGTWMFHCHILDHMINPSASEEGSENQIAAMGGLVTYLDVVPRGNIQADYLAAGSLMDPTCSKKY
jgi:hypothetical protein